MDEAERLRKLAQVKWRQQEPLIFPVKVSNSK